MQSSLLARIAFSLLFLVACRQAEGPEAVSSSAAAPRETVSSSTDSSCVASLRARMGARHRKDLPRPEAVVGCVGAEDLLFELAGKHRQLLIRARAIELLRHLASPRLESFAMQVASDRSQHRKLRAAAVRALGGLELAARPELRARLLELVDTEEVPVAVAAVDVLAQAGARLELTRTQPRHSLVKERVQQALTGGAARGP